MKVRLEWLKFIEKTTNNDKKNPISKKKFPMIIESLGTILPEWKQKFFIKMKATGL